MITTAVSGPTSFKDFMTRRLQRTGILFSDHGNMLFLFYRGIDVAIDCEQRAIALTSPHNDTHQNGVFLLTFKQISSSPITKQARRHLHDRTYLDAFIQPNELFLEILLEKTPGSSFKQLYWWEFLQFLGKDKPRNKKIPYPVWEFLLRLLDKKYTPQKTTTVQLTEKDVPV